MITKCDSYRSEITIATFYLMRNTLTKVLHFFISAIIRHITQCAGENHKMKTDVLICNNVKVEKCCYSGALCRTQRRRTREHNCDVVHGLPEICKLSMQNQIRARLEKLT